jgi:hypothetical protein
MTDKGRNLDLSTGAEPTPRPAAGGAAPGGKFLGVHFECCDVYSRVYPNREQTAYVGNCPRCAKRVEFLIGAEGTSSRFFRAY